MSHGITATDSGFVVHKPAWHGLFDVLKKRPKSPREAAKLAGIDWTVDQHDIVLAVHAGDVAAAKSAAARQEFYVPGFKANVRSDTGDTLGIVSDEYQPLQNLEVLQFADALLGETLFETAGSLHGGKQVFALLQVPESIEVGGDEVRQYIYLRTRHDGQAALWVWATNVRVVCANTDRMAIAEAGGPDAPDIYKVRHIGERSQVVAEARTALKLTVDYGKQFRKIGNRLASQKMSDRKLAAVLAELYPGGVSDGSKRAAERRRDAVVELFRDGPTVGNAPGSKWAAWNAITEFDQHHRKVRTKDTDLAGERRFLRSLEDTGNVQTRSFELIAAA